MPCSSALLRLDADISEATHVYVSSLCFPESLMFDVTVKLKQAGAAHILSCLRQVVALAHTSAFKDTCQPSLHNWLKRLLKIGGKGTISSMYPAKAASGVCEGIHTS
jgi:hypothetical protein